MLQKVQEVASSYMSGESTNGVAYANGHGNGHANGVALDGQVTASSSTKTTVVSSTMSMQSQSASAVDYVAVGGAPALSALNL